MSKEKCIYCGNDFEEIIGVHKEYLDGKCIVITNTPILFCKSCSEEYFSAEVSDRISEIINSININLEKDDIIFKDYKCSKN